MRKDEKIKGNSPQKSVLVVGVGGIGGKIVNLVSNKCLKHSEEHIFYENDDLSNIKPFLQKSSCSYAKRKFN